MHATLFKKIESGAAVLTVNRRLSRYLNEGYAHSMTDAGISVWQTPEILPLAAWSANLWGRYRPDRPLIPKTAAAALFEKIIMEDGGFSGQSILIPQGVVNAAFEAYRLLADYRLELPKSDFYLTEESRALKRWMTAYRQQLGKLGFIDETDITAGLPELMGDESVSLPSEIILAGFDEIAAATAELIDALRKRGSKVSFHPFSPPEPGEAITLPSMAEKPEQRRYADEEKETAAAARWVRAVYRPGMRIGIIVPDMNRYRPLIERAFSAELDPASLLPWHTATLPFNLSLGRTLYEEPLVRAALDLLALEGGKIETDRLSALLLSPWLAASEGERIILARIDQGIRRKNIASLSLRALHKMSGPYAEALPHFLKKLGAVHLFFSNTRGNKLPGQWAELFSDFLKESIFTSGENSLSSAEYQTLAAWQEMMAVLTSLDDITRKITKKEALRHLSGFAKERRHQPESADLPIEVMGLLEASGRNFDRVWLLGAHEDALPAAPSPNPFIPLSLQKQHNLPRSSMERELNFARLLVRRLILSTPSLIISAPKEIDGKEVRGSPLFRDFPLLEEASEPRSNCYAATLTGSVALEKRGEAPTIPLGDAESEMIKGGTAILKNQSACPFRAFAIHRLMSSSPETVEPGITAMERGKVVHEALAYFWSHVGDSNQLAKLAEENELVELIEDAVAHGVNMDPAASEDKEETGFKALERERLRTLLLEWIEIELERTPFKTSGTEKKKEITVGSLTLQGRIDRVDELESGEKIVIDYKTGSASPSDWLSERPADPQMMLYCLVEKFDAVAFARLKRGDAAFSGIARDGEMLPGIKAFGNDNFSKKTGVIGDWDALMEVWQKTVEALADAFTEGEAAVDPRDFGKEASACKYCDQTLLCRVFDC